MLLKVGTEHLTLLVHNLETLHILHVLYFGNWRKGYT